jgi:integrase
MARVNLQTPTSRARLAPRGKPYEHRLLRGVTLGFRRLETGPGSWVAIVANGKGGRWTSKIGAADAPGCPPDGTLVLDYEQAAIKARAISQGTEAHSARPATLDEALTAYAADLTARGRNTYGAQWVRKHCPQHLAAQSAAHVTTKMLRAWRDGLVSAGMLPATCNRLMKAAKAALALAGSLDPRVAANVDAWRTGLAEIPGAVKARDAVLTDKQVARAVAAAYAESDAFGVYTQLHAETGARTSQLLRCVVSDLERDRLQIPRSRKGRGGGKGGHIGVPLTASLAERLRRMAAGRGDGESLLVQPDGHHWKDQSRRFTRVARAAKLPAGTVLYSLRHSSIVRQILRNVPLKLVADAHDTSVAMIEKHYGRWIKHHGDDLIRAALVDMGPPAAEADKVVVPLRR